MKIYIEKGDNMEGRKRKAKRLCGLIGGMCLLFLMTKVYAADCYIEVQLEDLKSPYSDWEGVTLGLYDVGAVDEKGIPSIDVFYGISEYPQTAENSQKTVAKIEKKLEAEPLMSKKTDADGKIVFSGIDCGVYLIRAVDSSEYGIITSSLVHLPYYEVIEDEQRGPLFSVKINPKASLPGKPTVPVVTVTPKPTVTITPNPDAPGNPGGNNPGNPSNPGRADGAKTGDESHVAGYGILLGISAASAGIIIWKRRKVSE